jgi:hypothetical protein
VAKIQVGPDHVIGGVIHVQVIRDTAQSDPQKMFTATVHAPGMSKDLPLHNGSSLDVPVNVPPVVGSVHAQVDDFRLVPPGDDAKATAIACLVVFRLIEGPIRVTIGSVPVTAALRSVT